MIKTKLFTAISSVGLVVLAIVLISGDHNDAPSLAGTSADIADFYTFQAPNPDNLVLVMNVQGMNPAGSPTDQAEFDEDVLMEFNIDLNNDLKEDVLIQAIKRRDSMFFFGPFQTSETGLESIINTEVMHKVKISNKDTIYLTEEDNMKFFAGTREDPFFFDRTQFDAYLDGNAVGGFTDPGSDTYLGTNVLSIVVELPKVMLGTPVTNVNPFAPNTPTYTMWVETKRKIK